MIGILVDPSLFFFLKSSAKVENLLWGRYGRAKAHEYRHHARMLRTNLSNAGNAELRARVLSGELKPEVLKLTPEVESAWDFHS